MVISCACACVCSVCVCVERRRRVGSGARTAPRWSEAGCSVAACPGAGRARRRPSTTPTMPCGRAARNYPTMNMVSPAFIILLSLIFRPWK